MMNTSFYIILILILAQLCSSPSYAANQDQVRLLWPAPPNLPQLEFVGVFTSEDDLKKSKGRGFLVTFLKEDLEQNLSGPTSVATLDTNTVLVSERGSENIKVFDFAKGETRELFQKTLPFFEAPVDVVIDAGKNIFVVDQKRGVIAVFDNVLNPTHRIGINVEFKRLEKAAIDPVTQTLYVSDSGLNKVFAFDPAGQLLFEVGEGENPDGEDPDGEDPDDEVPDNRLKSPHGLAVDSQGRLYVADTGSSKIKIFDSDGSFLRVFKFKNDSSSSVLDKPWDLAFDSQGLLHIIDQRMAAVITCTLNGEVLFATMASRRTNHPMGFSRPSDIHIDSKDRIIITDAQNNRFVMWQILTKAFLAENPVTDKDIETLKRYIAKLQKRAKEGTSTEAIAMQNEEEKKNLEGALKKTKKKRHRVACPNCDTQYDLVLIGLDNQ